MSTPLETRYGFCPMEDHEVRPKLHATLARLLGFEPDQIDDKTKLHGITFGTLLHVAAAAWFQGRAAGRSETHDPPDAVEQGGRP